jgi:hypothetical protein
MAASSCTSLVDIRGINKLSLLKKLWLYSGQIRPDYANWDRTIKCSDDRWAQRLITNGFIEYFGSYAIRCDLSGDFVDATQWDAMPRRHMNFQSIVSELRTWPPDPGRAYTRPLSAMLLNQFRY